MRNLSGRMQQVLLLLSIVVAVPAFAQVSGSDFDFNAPKKRNQSADDYSQRFGLGIGASAGTALERGLVAQRAGEFGHAISIYEKGLQTDGNNVEMRYQLLISQLAVGRYQDCIANGERARQIAGANLAPKISGLLGSCLDRAGQQKSAATVYKNALKRYPKDPNLLLSAGLSALRADQVEHGSTYLQAAADIEPSYASPHYYLAQVYGEDKQRFWAVAALTRFLVFEKPSPRGQEAGRWLADTLKSFYKISKRGTKAQLRKEEQNTLSMALGMVLATKVEAGQRNRKDKVSAHAQALAAICEALDKANSGNDLSMPEFERENYLKFMAEIAANGHSLTFAHAALASTGDNKVTAWIKSNESKTKEFYTWLQQRYGRE